jgi:transposase-like protein
MTALNQPHFQDADKARQYLEALRWPEGPVCPHCGVIGDHYALQGKTTRAGLWKCHDCREQFSVTVGTVFERSKIKLNVWLQAVFLLCSSKKGMSAHQLHRTLGVTYKTAWFMAHRIREAMKSDGGLMGGGGQIVEVDETYFGTAPGVAKRNSAGKKMTGGSNKMKIMALVERGGKVRSVQIHGLKSADFKAVLDNNLHPESHLMTDEAWQYHRIGKDYLSHQTVNHERKEYARGNVTTNTIEGVFSIFKRGMIGTYQHCGSQHLERYTTEFDFRYNNRAKLGVTDSERAAIALKGIAGKRLTYRRTNAQ